MKEQFQREISLIGEESFEKLQSSRVAVFGLGGVGGNCAEALARAGVGALDLIDGDRVAKSNINRQLFATHSTVGMYKTEAAKARLLDINPALKITVCSRFFSPENAAEFDFSAYDYVVDAIDDVKGKLSIVACAKAAGVPVICAMGAGNKMDPTAFRIADIEKTQMCPLAKVMRVALRKQGIKGVKVVYSEEPPAKPAISAEGKAVPTSISFVPPAMGLCLAGAVVKDIISMPCG